LTDPDNLTGVGRADDKTHQAVGIDAAQGVEDGPQRDKSGSNDGERQDDINLVAIVARGD